jgi:hypothetical protein
MIVRRHERHLLDDPVRLRLLLTLIHALNRPTTRLLLLVGINQVCIAVLSLLLLDLFLARY